MGPESVHGMRVVGVEVRRSRFGPGLAAALIVVLGAVASWLINQLNPGTGWGWVALVATVLVVLAAAALQFWTSTRRAGRIGSRVSAVKPADWAVARPRELDALVGLLVDRAGGTTIGLTTALHGAGGFGKTTLARMVCRDPRVRRRFRGGSYELTVGQDVRGAALADKINSAVEFLAGERPAAADPEQAGQELAALLSDGPPRILVLDDVWSGEQLSPFLFATGDSAILVTTRIPAILPAGTGRVTVDQMTPAQARDVLGYGVDPLPTSVAKALVKATGGWALLLSLVNADLRATAADGGDVALAARAALDRLARFGPTAFDVTEAGDRGKAVHATIDASLSRLSTPDVDRLCELGIFAEDAHTPLDIVAALWRSTGGMSEEGTGRLCRRLDQLSLLRLHHDTVSLHDVVRGYLRHRLGPDALAAANAALVDDLAARVGPPEDPTEDDEMIGPPDTAWWRLGDDQPYLWRHLPYHLTAAGRPDAAEALALDLRWVGGKLVRLGPAAVVGDLAGSTKPPAVSLVRVLEQSAHLLAATEPDHAVVGILLSRLADHPDWVDVMDMAYRRLDVPALRPRWRLCDEFDPALRRVLHGHSHWVQACAIAPDGTWFATGCNDWTVRIWDAATGHVRSVLRGHTTAVEDCAISPDGTWLASAGTDHTVRIWDVATGRESAVLEAPFTSVHGCAIAPDGSWLAGATGDGSVLIWDVASRRVRMVLAGHEDMVFACAIAPDGTWLASASRDQTVRIWDAATGDTRAVLAGHDNPVLDCAVAPDGSWLVSVSSDRSIRIWDTATGEVRQMLTGLQVNCCAIAPDGTWLAAAGDDRTIRTFDAAALEIRSVLLGHTDYVQACAIAPDGNWLVSAGSDQTVRTWDAHARRGGGTSSRPGPRPTDVVFGCAIAPDGTTVATGAADDAITIWDVATGDTRAVLAGHTNFVLGCAFSPDGQWLASASNDHTARIWDLATGRTRVVLEGHTGTVNHCAISPDGTWLATSSVDQTVRIWDVETGEERVALGGHTDKVYRCAISPDGTWLASAAADRTVRIWDAAIGEERMVLKGHTDVVVGCAIAPDGSWLASAASDDTVRIWDARTGEARATLTDHTDRALDCAIGPDGSWLVSVGVDQTLRVWDTATWRCMTLIRLENALNCVHVRGNTILTVGDRGIYLFDLAGRRLHAGP